MRGRGEFRSHGGKKITGDSVRPCSHAAVSARVDTVTSGNYHKTPFLRGVRRGHQVVG